MIQFRTLFTGSTGNLHTCTDGDTEIALDFGVPFPKAQNALGFNVSGLAGILAGHSHRDHCKGLPGAIRAGIDCYALDDVFTSLDISSHHRAHAITPLTVFRIESFQILPFSLQHDVPNVGFLIQSDHGGKLLYITDSYYSKYVFSGVTVFAVECNYCDDILAENIRNRTIHPSHRNRIKKSHFSLENVKAFFQANDLSKCREIHLIHGSSTNLDKNIATSEVQMITGLPTFCH